MSFNSLDFILLLSGVLLCYGLVPPHRRWILLLAASYYSYACWRPEYVVLLALSTAIDYWAGLRMGRAETRRARRPYLIFSLCSNLGILFAFKYASFVNENLRQLFSAFNIFYDVPSFQLLLPLGISFYTFQSLSYSIDVYRGKCRPERHAGIFALYIAFFPQLVAGPIERATRLIPQLQTGNRLEWQNIRTGCLLILWGYFLKLVIADRLAIYVDEVFSNLAYHQGGTILAASYFFGYQLFCDFAGYSLIALGAARIFGIELMTNFNRPFSARTVGEFWLRWHISLTTWMRDYCFRPLLRWGRTRGHIALAVLLVGVLFGLWHGASWNFALFGLYVALTIVAGYATRRSRTRFMAAVLPEPSLRFRWLLHAFQVMTVFHIYIVGALIFRVESLKDLLMIAERLNQGAQIPLIRLPGFGLWDFMVVMTAIGTLEAVQWCQARPGLRVRWWRAPRYQRWCAYYALIFSILILGEFHARGFVYFQF